MSFLTIIVKNISILVKLSVLGFTVSYHYFKKAMRYILIILVLLSCLPVWAQDTALASRLHRMVITDQDARNELIKIRNDHNGDSPAVKTVIARAMAIDKENNTVLKSILKQYGFPGYKRVGETGADHFWLLVQHQDEDTAFQKEVLVLMKKAVAAKDASPSSYAMLVDRVLSNTGKKQLYGTQFSLNKDKTSFEPQPIEDSLHVDKRRAEMGLPPLAENLKQMNEVYKTYLEPKK